MLRDVPQERNSLTNTPEPDSETNRAKRTAEQASRQASRRAPGRQPGSAYWLLVRNENGPLEVLITGHTAGEEALPALLGGRLRFASCLPISLLVGCTDDGTDGLDVFEGHVSNFCSHACISNTVLSPRALARSSSAAAA